MTTATATLEQQRARLWREDGLAFVREALAESYPNGLDDWQAEDFRAAFASPARHVWWERPRGHSKSQDAAAVALHHALTTRGARAVIGATDRDQGGLLMDSLRGFVSRSPALQSAVSLTKWALTVPSVDSQIEVLAADAASSWGLRPTLVIADELSMWYTAEAETFFTALASSLGKVKGARMIVCLTAGTNADDSLAWRTREQIRIDPSWTFSRRGQCASWVSARFLDQQRRMLSDDAYKRLHLNEWTGTTGAFLPLELWDACLDEKLPNPTPLTEHVVALDAGVRHDAFAAVAVTRDPRTPADNVILRASQVWTPTRGQDVQFTGDGSPWAWLTSYCHANGVVKVAFDEYQLADFCQRFQREEGIWCEPFSQQKDREIADVRLQALIRERRLAHDGNHNELRRHIGNAVLKSSGDLERGRLTKQHPARKIDAAVALSMAASECLRLNLRA